MGLYYCTNGLYYRSTGFLTSNLFSDIYAAIVIQRWWRKYKNLQLTTGR